MWNAIGRIVDIVSLDLDDGENMQDIIKTESPTKIPIKHEKFLESIGTNDPNDEVPPYDTTIDDFP
jgi:hypothetical protein